jgi:hypothetical protein
MTQLFECCDTVCEPALYTIENCNDPKMKFEIYKKNEIGFREKTLIN